MYRCLEVSHVPQRARRSWPYYVAMPTVEVRWRSGDLDEASLLALRDELKVAVAEGLEAVDPNHLVTPEMVDVRFTPLGPLDDQHAELLVTVLARHEQARHRAAPALVEVWARAVAESTGVLGAVVELVLTDHQSSFDYTTMEQPDG